MLFCHIALSSSNLTSANTVRSYANSNRKWTSATSLTNYKNNNGPKFDPCVMPEVAGY